MIEFLLSLSTMADSLFSMAISTVLGLVLYLILALSDPFQGGIGVGPTTFEHLVEKM